MGSVEENLQALSRAVQSEARAEAEHILAEARTQAEAIRQHAQEQAAAERTKILERAAWEAERRRSQTIATTQLKARALQLERREKLLDSVFEAARQQLPSVRQWADYGQIAHYLSREALGRLGADAAQIRADEQIRMHLTDQALADISRELGVQVQLGRPLEQGTGVIVETMDGNRQYDDTLEARLSRSQDALRSSVYHLLMGESP